MNSINVLPNRTRVLLIGGVYGTVVGHGATENYDRSVRMVYIVRLDELQQNAEQTITFGHIVVDPSAIAEIVTDFSSDNYSYDYVLPHLPLK